VAVGALGALLLAAGTARAAGAARGARTHKRHRRPPAALRVRVLGPDAGSIARRRRVRVRVRARHDAVVRLYATLAPDAHRASAAVISRPGSVVLRARHARTISLPLSRSAAARLSACGGHLLEVRARLLGHGRRLGRHVYRGRRHLAGVARCRTRRPIPFDAADLGRCDPIDPAVCLQPFPDDYFTVRDASTQTGRRVSLDAASMPTNRAGKPIDPSDIDRNDGFSPGSPIVTKVPGLDTQEAFQRTGAVPITDVGQTYREDQPIVVLNTRTLQRQLIWAEIDANPGDPANRNLIIRPAVNLEENTRYIVALRKLRDASGRLLSPSDAFRIYRDGTPTSNPDIEARREHFENLFANLAAAGIDRDSLYLAWDFTVASERSLSERQLTIRNDAFAQLGDRNLADLTIQGRAPAYAVTKVTDYTPGQDPEIARQVEGSYTVPCYLNVPGCPPGSRFSFPAGSTHGPPQWSPGNTMQAHFTCNIPRAAMAGGGARPSLYGHGLFGSRMEIDQQQLHDMAQEHDFVFCATDWVGMACADTPEGSSYFQALVGDLVAGAAPNTPNCDVPTAFADETDLSNFPTLVDRVDQAFVNAMYLGRLMIHPDGLGQNSAFRNGSGSVIDARRLFYDGNSQGGIFGASLIALEPDLDRGVVGVPGMNFSLLLQRSTDFGTGQPPRPDPTNPASFVPEFAYPLYQSYPNELQRQLILSLIQQMWDHSDPDGLAHHITTDPLPDTPAHHVLMHVALGDHQVTQYAAQVEARTIGARARLPWADPGRHSERDPTYGLAPISSFPYDGSAIVMWDAGPIRSTGCPPGESSCGNDVPPVANVPPSTGADPHELPRRSAAARQQKSDFLQIGGRVTNPCGTRPCYDGSWSGP